VESWENLEKEHPGEVLITPEGQFSQGEPSERLIPKDAAERLAIARRLVADRCIYGVDINPMAVEMAKLSIWLITVDKTRPFTFLDHALKCGDSLLGITRFKQLETFSLDDEHAKQVIILSNYDELIQTAIAKRRELEMLPSNDAAQIATKQALLSEAEERMERLKLAADLLIAAELTEGREQKKEMARAAAHIKVTQYIHRPIVEFRRFAEEQIDGRRRLHWPLEFPEIFRSGGFNAFVGNPPFLGGLKLETAFGASWRAYLVKYLAGGIRGVRGTADLCVYFILRACQLVQHGGGVGLVATNTTSEGDSRVVGLDQLIDNGFTLHRAVRSSKWPGTANLEVSQLWLRRGIWNGLCFLDERLVGRITPYLAPEGDISGTPYPLLANAGTAFQGSIILGKGLILDFDEGKQVLQNNMNRNVVLPYMNGDDLNSRFDQSPSRWVINFRDWPLSRETAPSGYEGPVASDYSDCLRIVDQRAKPERMQYEPINAWNRKVRNYWWHFGQYRWALEKAMDGVERVLVACRHTKYVAHSLVHAGPVFDVALNVIVVSTGPFLSILESNIYETWVRTYSSSLETRLRYTLNDCFETFPFPLTKTMDSSLGSLGDSFHKYRQSLMNDRKEGITDTYNRFHDASDVSADIAQLRMLHVEVDQAVVAAYGWDDLDLGHNFHDTKQGVRFTINEASRSTVMNRLLALNHQRYAEEARAGLHEKKAPSNKRGRTESKPLKTTASQGELL
jgi:hypothetical protein